MAPARRDRPAPVRGAAGIRARYRRILRFAAWNLAVTWWFELFLPRVGFGRVAGRTCSKRMQGFARNFRLLAVDLGGLMIKVGQFLSSRLDVLPPEITRELEDLQDEVPPVPFPAIRALAEQELGAPVEQVFAFVEEAPVTAGSACPGLRGSGQPGASLRLKTSRPSRSPRPGRSVPRHRSG